MKLQPAKLAEHLKGPLAPVYVVSGDEPLLVEETVDALRAAGRAAGVTGREVFFIERSAPWNDIRHATQALSLFAEQRIIEIRMPGGKPGHGAATLIDAINAAGQDYTLLVITNKLDRDAQGSQWLQAAEERGVWIALWPVDTASFPGWIRERLARRGLTATPGAIALLAERTEGNLLAAQQEIEKLSLSGERELDERAVLASVSDSTHFDVFQLSEAALSGDAPRTLRILDSLRDDGTEPTLLMWTLARELRNVWNASHGSSGGGRGGYYGSRGGAVTSAASRLARGGDARRGPFPRLAERASRADRMIKGQIEGGDPWEEIALLAVELAGKRVLPIAPRPQRSRLPTSGT